LAKTDLRGGSFRDFLRIIFTNKTTIVGTFLGVTVLVILLTLVTPAKYETATKILAKERKIENPLEMRNYNDFRTERVAFLQSLMEIIQSDEVTKRVLRKLTPNKPEPSLKDIRAFQQKVKVLSPKGFDVTTSDILLIQVTDSNPVRTTDGANFLTDEFINYTYELKGKSSKQTITFLEKHLQDTIAKMKVAEEQTKNFEGRAGADLAFLLATVKQKGTNSELITYNSNYINAKTSLHETESYITQLRTLIQKGTIPNKVVRENPVLANIKDNIAKLQNQLANLRSQYTDQFPKNIMLKKEIENNKLLLKQELEADLSGRYVDVLALEARIKSLKDTLDHYTYLSQKQLEYSRIFRNYEVIEEEVQNIQKEIQKAKTAEAMDTYKLANIEIIDRARVPKSPISPDILFNIFVGALLGILLGLGLAFIKDRMDHTLKSVEDVERYLNLTVLGSLPRT
jgi:polysaccharide biosynthesis transport protein